MGMYDHMSTELPILCPIDGEELTWQTKDGGDPSLRYFDEGDQMPLDFIQDGWVEMHDYCSATGDGHYVVAVAGIEGGFWVRSLLIDISTEGETNCLWNIGDPIGVRIRVSRGSGTDPFSASISRR